MKTKDKNQTKSKSSEKLHKLLAEMNEFVHKKEQSIDAIRIEKKKAKGEEYKSLLNQELEHRLALLELTGDLMDIMFDLKDKEMRVCLSRKMIES